MAEYNLQLAEHYFRLLKYDKQLAVNLKPEKNSESFEEAREPVEVCLQKKCSSNKTKDPSGPNKRRGSKSKEQPAAELDN